MRVVFGFIALSLILATCVFGVAAYWAVQEFDRPNDATQESLFLIQRGDTASRVASRLHAAGLIQYPQLFTYGGRITGHAVQIKAGEYQIAPAMSTRGLLELFASGKVYQRFVTLREGLTSYGIVQELRKINVLREQEDITIPAEGTLLPETYSYARGDSVHSILSRMSAAMDETLDSLWETRAADLPFQTKEEALILASIVEKETGVGGERAKVAGVFVNRLKRGMLLQTDPTVIYALTRGRHENGGQGPIGRRLLRKDLKVDSPYNTYLYAGLPPTPIANPGREAIAATLNPEQHNYLYFVADGTGGHVFSKTLAEHNRNAAKWRKIRASQ